MMYKLLSKRKYVTDAAIASLFSVTYFYLLNILEVAEPLYIPYKDTAEMMIFYIFFSIFLISAAFMVNCRSKFDVFLLAVTPYALTATFLALKSHTILCIAMMLVILMVTSLKIVRLFVRRKPTTVAKRKKLIFRAAVVASYFTRVLSVGCAVVMLILIDEIVYERAVNQYELRKFWEEHAGMSLDEIIFDDDTDSVTFTI